MEFPMVFLSLLLLAGCEDTDAQGRLDSLEAELASLTTKHDEDVAALQTRLNAAEAALTTCQSDIDSLEAADGAQDSELASLREDVDANTSDVLDLYDDVDGLTTALNGNSSRISTLEGAVSDTEDVVAYAEDLFTYLTVDTSDDSVVFSGVNVFVNSGSGSTDGTVNGLGNLIVGYNEQGSSDFSTGSHNLIVGRSHSYSSYGGVLFGYNNVVTGTYSSVLGGLDNEVSGEDSAILGGAGNEVSGNSSTVYGGIGESVSGTWVYAP